MESLSRGFEFFKQSWRMAFADRDLLKPSIIALFVGFIVTLIFSVPVVLTFVVFGDSGFGRVVGSVFSAILIFVQYIVTYIFSGMTIYLIFGYLREGDGRMDRAWQAVRREFLNIISLAAASTGVSLLKSFIQGKKNSGLRNAVAGLLDTVWTEATYLVLPAMMVDGMNLRDSLRRATHIVRDNLLLVTVSTVGVRFVTGLIGFLLGGTGIALGLGIGLGLVSISGGAPLGVISGITLGVLVAGTLILISVVIASYTATAYHTCLYLWARDVERARLEGRQESLVLPPAPLAAVLHS